MYTKRKIHSICWSVLPRILRDYYVKQFIENLFIFYYYTDILTVYK